VDHDPIAALRSGVQESLSRAKDDLGIVGELRLTRPKESRGDLAIPCHAMSREAPGGPVETARALAVALSAAGPRHSFSSEGAFVNITFDPASVVRETLRSALGLRDRYGSRPPSGRKVLVEHTSANPTGPLHVGRARNPIIGDALARLLRAAGNEVATEFYVNDVGKQVASLAWGCANLPGGAATPSDIVKRYQEASDLLKKKDPRATDAVAGLLRKLEAGEEEACASVERFTSIVLKEMEAELLALDIRFDRFTHESSFVKSGRVRALFDDLDRKGVVRRDGGALYMDLQGDEERFYLTRSDGTSLYSSRDIAYHDDKFRRAGACINVLGEDQKHAFRQLSTALSALGLIGTEGRSFEALFYGIVNLPGDAPGSTKKMSTRAGTAVALRELMEEAKRRAREEVIKRRSDLEPRKVEQISSEIAVGAVRYNIVRIQPEKAIVFRWEDALSFTGDAAPFLQYAHARCMSVFRKAKEERAWSFPEDLGNGPVFDPGHLDASFELPLLKAIAWLPSTIHEAASRRSPHLIAAAAFDIADRFMRYYEHVHFLASEHWRARLEVVAAAKFALATALGIVGVPAVDEM
jgi:arginyl-tRNA synthetase